ncbi:MAG: tetratricopeptide repeat protein [Pirellulales bacterium]
MTMDPYALCPCGSGKKLKFCCADLVGDIEKIHRMIGGDQPRAALRHVEQSLARHPGRASLLDLKATLEISLDELDAARATVDEFVSTHADSPTAHACRALYLAQQENEASARAAAEALQRALALVDRDMPQRVFEALGAVGSALLMAGHIVAAQAYLWLHAVIAPADDVRARELLVGLNHYSGLPVLVRDQLRFRAWPEGAAWRNEAEAASRLADNGRWRQAVEIVDRLGQRHGADPALVYNRAVLGGWLADDRALVAGLHGFAQLEVPLDDAVEAEAVAQLLDPECREQPLDSVVQTYDVNDLDALVARLTSDGRLALFELDPSTPTEEGQPPPRHTYLLLDRPQPPSGEGLTRGDVPSFVGAVAVFGRQTDRRERLELTTDKGPEFDATIATLQAIAGDALGPMSVEQVVGGISPTQQALNRRWHFPADTPPDLRRSLVEAEHRASIVDRWPDIPRPGLGGKTPREAAGEPELRIPLLASVLILEQGANQRLDDRAIDELRRKLGLAAPEPIEPTADGVSTLPIVRVPRLPTERLSDDDLVALYRRAMLIGANAATVHLAQEVVRRPSLAERIPPREAFRRMIAVESDPQRALALIGEARRRSEAAGELTVIWDLAELEEYIESGNSDQASATLTRINREHPDDPDVSAALYRLLYRLGAIRQEDMVEEPALDEPTAAVPVGAEAEPANRIWTPGSDRPSGGKSPLWTPS